METLGEVLELVSRSGRATPAVRGTALVGGERWRFWHQRPDRWRTEHADIVAVRVGAWFWRLGPGGTAFAERNRDVGFMHASPLQHLIEPAALLSVGVLEIDGPGTVAGRATRRVTLSPRVRGRLFSSASEVRWALSGRLLIDIDDERGIVLRAVSPPASDSAAGEQVPGGDLPWEDVEFEEVSFDEELDGQIFACPHPPGAQVQGSPTHQEVSLGEGLHATAFPALAPTLLPEGSSLRSCLVASDRSWISFSYGVAPGERYYVNVWQEPCTQALLDSENAAGERVVSHGVDVVVRRSFSLLGEKVSASVRLGEASASVESNLPAESVVPIAATLRPVS